MPLLEMFLREIRSPSRTDICIPTFMAALFTKAKAWKLKARRKGKIDSAECRVPENSKER